MHLRHRQWKIGECVIDEGRQLITHNGQEISVRTKLLSTLVCLIEQYPKVVESDELIDMVWGAYSSVSKAGVNHTIWCLRQMLAAVGVEQDIIETIPKRGYRLVRSPIAMEPPLSDTISARAMTPSKRATFALEHKLPSTSKIA